MAGDEGEVTALHARIATIAGEVEGVVGVYAKDLGDGAEVCFNADLVFPLASVMKVPTLFELYRQGEEGRIDLTARMPFERRHLVPGSGVLQDLDFGIAPTVKDLATLMITVSDNAATDMILDLIGLDNLEATMRRLGLTSTAFPLTIRGLLYNVFGMDPADPAHTYELYQERSKAGAIDWNCRAYADEGNNVSTPREIGGLLEGIERRAILDAGSCDAMIDILKRQKYTTRIPRHLPEGTEVAYKTGSLRGVCNDAGIVYGPRGPYVIALFAKRLADPVAGDGALAAISRAVYEVFGGPIPARRYGPAPAAAAR